MPSVAEVRAASKARVEARKAEVAAAQKRVNEEARRARVKAATAEKVAEIEEAVTDEIEASLKVTKAQTKAIAAERRARAALTRAENTEAMLQREQARVAELEAQLAGAPRDGEFKANAAHKHTEGVPLPGRGLSKVTKTARANLYAAFEDMGGVEELVRWGRGNPTEFYRIWARLIPVEVEDESKNMPLETLLDMLSKRADQTVEQAATAIGHELLDKAREEVDVEAAASLFREQQK